MVLPLQNVAAVVARLFARPCSSSNDAAAAAPDDDDDDEQAVVDVDDDVVVGDHSGDWHSNEIPFLEFRPLTKSHASFCLSIEPDTALPLASP